MIKRHPSRTIFLEVRVKEAIGCWDAERASMYNRNSQMGIFNIIFYKYK